MPCSTAARRRAIISCLSFGGPYPKLIPMQPSPNADKADSAIEHSPGLDSPLKNVRQEFLDVSPHRSRPAADRHIIVKRWLRSGNGLLLRNADAPHRATRAGDADRGIHR